MNKKLTLIGTLVALLMIIMPAAVHAANSWDVYAPKSGQPVTESDVLSYAADKWQNGYINELFTTSQSTTQERIDWLRQQAMNGFDPNTSDPYIYSMLLPNSATLNQVTTWFGHPVVMADGNYVIKDWFGPGNDAVVFTTVADDVRTYDGASTFAY